MVTYPVKVLVVDDSAYLRKAVSEMLMRSPRLEVVGTARDGLDALEKVIELKPDVVTVDLFMPDLDGVGFLQAQMASRPLPVVVCSVASESGEKAIAAMEAGAVEFIRKPTSLSNDRIYEMAEELIQKVLTAATVPPEKLGGIYSLPVQVVPTLPSFHGAVEAVVFGVSTGGPQALRYLLPLFPEDFPAPVAIVLHIPTGYTGPLAKRLDEHSLLEVLEAEEGLEMRPGRAILARAGRHLELRLKNGNVVSHLTQNPRNSPHCPSVDVLFSSAAAVYGPRTLGIVLTGMGDDGTRGAAAIKAQGGQIFTEDESTSIVYGMPRSVVEAGLSDRIIPLDSIVSTILETI